MISWRELFYIISWEKKAKHYLVPACKTWGFAAFLCHIIANLISLDLGRWSNKKSTLKCSWNDYYSIIELVDQKKINYQLYWWFIHCWSHCFTIVRTFLSFLCHVIVNTISVFWIVGWIKNSKIQLKYTSRKLICNYFDNCLVTAFKSFFKQKNVKHFVVLAS